MGKRWTDAEIAELRRLVEVEKLCTKTVAHRLNRPYYGVTAKANFLKIKFPGMRPYVYTEKVVTEIVKYVAMGATNDEICAQIGVSLESLKRKLSELNIKRHGKSIKYDDRFWNKYEDLISSGLPPCTVAERFGIKPQNLNNAVYYRKQKAKILGL
jgi:hypothetical protein